jgi:hypothetical protein
LEHFNIMPKGDISVQDQLDEILSLLRSQGAEISETKRMLADSQARVVQLETEVSGLKKEVKKLKESANDRDQVAKARTVRLFGFPTSDDENATDGGRSFQSKIYDRILKPCLASAKSSGDIQSVPQFATAIEKMYRAGKPNSSGRPAPVVITFTSEILRLAVLRHKKSALPAPSATEKASGTRRFMIVEDLTPANYSMLKQLQGREEVSRAWSIEGRLRFTLVDNDKVFRVKSVFDPIESIIFVS